MHFDDATASATTIKAWPRPHRHERTVWVPLPLLLCSALPLLLLCRQLGICLLARHGLGHPVFPLWATTRIVAGAAAAATLACQPLLALAAAVAAAVIGIVPLLPPAPPARHPAAAVAAAATCAIRVGAMPPARFVLGLLLLHSTQNTVVNSRWGRGQNSRLHRGSTLLVPVAPSCGASSPSSPCAAAPSPRAPAAQQRCGPARARRTACWLACTNNCKEAVGGGGRWRWRRQVPHLRARQPRSV